MGLMLGQELFRRLPHERKLTETEEREAQKLLGLRANKKMVQNRLASQTGKVILLRDLSNVAKKLKSSETRNDLQECVRRLTNVYGMLIVAIIIIH